MEPGRTPFFQTSQFQEAYNIQEEISEACLHIMGSQPSFKSEIPPQYHLAFYIQRSQDHRWTTDRLWHRSRYLRQPIRIIAPSILLPGISTAYRSLLVLDQSPSFRNQ